MLTQNGSPSSTLGYSGVEEASRVHAKSYSHTRYCQKRNQYRSKDACLFHWKIVIDTVLLIYSFTLKLIFVGFPNTSTVQSFIWSSWSVELC